MCGQSSRQTRSDPLRITARSDWGDLVLKKNGSLAWTVARGSWTDGKFFSREVWALDSHGRQPLDSGLELELESLHQRLDADLTNAGGTSDRDAGLSMQRARAYAVAARPPHSSRCPTTGCSASPSAWEPATRSENSTPERQGAQRDPRCHAHGRPRVEPTRALSPIAHSGSQLGGIRRRPVRLSCWPRRRRGSGDRAAKLADFRHGWGLIQAR